MNRLIRWFSLWNEGAPDGGDAGGASTASDAGNGAGGSTGGSTSGGSSGETKGGEGGALANAGAQGGSFDEHPEYKAAKAERERERAAREAAGKSTQAGEKKDDKPDAAGDKAAADKAAAEKAATEKAAAEKSAAEKAPAGDKAAEKAAAEKAAEEKAAAEKAAKTGSQPSQGRQPDIMQQFVALQRELAAVKEKLAAVNPKTFESAARNAVEDLANERNEQAQADQARQRELALIQKIADPALREIEMHRFHQREADRKANEERFGVLDELRTRIDAQVESARRDMLAGALLKPFSDPNIVFDDGRGGTMSVAIPGYQPSPEEVEAFTALAEGLVAKGLVPADNLNAAFGRFAVPVSFHNEYANRVESYIGKLREESAALRAENEKLKASNVKVAKTAEELKKIKDVNPARPGPGSGAETRPVRPENMSREERMRFYAENGLV